MVTARDESSMRDALALARQVRDLVSPNPRVGAVIERDGRVVGRGFHRGPGTAHAESMALADAGPHARDATLYVTLEPCTNYGHTPPCVATILRSGVRRVVVGSLDPNPRENGRGVEQLRRAGLEVEAGVLGEECLRLNEGYNKHIVRRLPFVTLKAALSLDGKIATSTGESQWITGPEARAHVHQMRDEADAIMIGVGTALRDDPRLTTRPQGGGGRDPVRVVVDSHLRTPPHARVIASESAAPCWLATLEGDHGGRAEALLRSGARLEILRLKPSPKGVDLADLCAELGRRQITSVLLEGGARLNASALEAGIVDKVVFFLAPLLIGGEGAPGPVGGHGVEWLREAYRLDTLTLEPVGRDWMAWGYLEAGG